MRKFVSILTVGLVICSASAYAGTEILENFNNYETGTDAQNNSNLKYSGLGNELIAASIVGDNIDNSIQMDFDSATGQSNAWFSFGLIQSIPLATPKNLTGGTLSFDIKTDLSQSWAGVLSPQLTVWTETPGANPGDPSTFAYETWRLQNYLGQVWGSLKQPLLDLVPTDWTTVTVNVDDLIYNDLGNWHIPHFDDVVGMDVLVLQVNTDIQGTGTVLLDNIQWSGDAVPEPGAMLLCAFGGVIALIRKKIRK